MSKLRIVFFAMNNRYGSYPLQKIINENDYEIIEVIEGMPRKYKNNKSNIKELLWKIKNRSDLKKICKKNNISHRYSKDVNSSSTINNIKSLSPDLICISGFSQLVKEDILNIPSKGVINIHPSKLPKYKGPNPWVWYYYNMDEVGGITVHFVDKGEDSGDIILQDQFQIPFGMTSVEMWDVVLNKGAKLLIKSMDSIKNGTVVRTSQNHLECNFRARNLKAGEKLIDFGTWDVKRVFHFLRGTYTWYREGIDICEYYDIEIKSYSESNVQRDTLGEIYDIDSNNAKLICKNGEVLIGKKLNLKKLIKFYIRKLVI